MYMEWNLLNKADILECFPNKTVPRTVHSWTTFLVVANLDGEEPENRTKDTDVVYRWVVQVTKNP